MSAAASPAEAAQRPLTLYHSPRTRSTGVLALLEQLGMPYTLEVVQRGAQLAPAFRAINPLGKVPALRDGSAVITEQVAICLHLADLFPAAGLAPGVTDPLRGPYLRWMVFYAAAFEPALIDKARGYEPGNRAMSPYGSYDEVLDTLAAALDPGPYLLGATLTAADVLWGVALGWTMQIKLVPPRPIFASYAERVAALPGVRQATARDAQLKAASPD